MTDAETIIAEAAKLPLKDAAYILWRQCDRLDSLEFPPMTAEEVAKARATPMDQIMARIKYEHDHAEDGPTFGRLKRAHPKAADADARQAISAAVKFNDDCFQNFNEIEGEFGARCANAVALAAKGHPGYQKRTYQTAEYWVQYYMK